MYLKYIKISFLFFLIAFTGHISQAQEVFIIPQNQATIDGETMNIKPGDSVLLEGGVRGQLELKNIKGSDEQPVVITLKDEKVIIDTDAHTAVPIENCGFVHLTGEGGKEKYGIEIASAGTMGIYVTEYSTNFEIDHVEIHQVGFAGIIAKTDPNCSRRDLRDFVMKDLSFHDNLIFDTGGEGFYVGYSWYPTREVDCDNSQVTIYPHAIHGVRIYNNIIRDTGWDGLQVGSATEDVAIYGNTIENYGIENELYQNHAVQIGAGTTGDFYNNLIHNGTGGGISFFGSGNNRLYNNIIVGNGENAIYHNDKGAKPGTRYQIYNNTIVNPAKGGIDLNAANTNNNLVANNLIVLGEGFFGITGDGSKWKSEGNQVYDKISEVGFKYPDTLNFRLTDGSKSIDAGHDVSHLDFDYDFNARPANGKYDVGAFEFDSEPYVPILSVSGDDEEDIVVFPNPSRGTINLNISGNANPDSIIIYDQIGRTVLSSDLESKGGSDHELRMNTSLKEGIYFIKVYQKNEQVIMKKVIVNANE